ncbi:MAG TPA: hypothetical protein VH374_07380 [Polyangia bacterium]|jgi:hypothetical protein|nr:hypothetical protein [Polyangia bacterium]
MIKTLAGTFMFIALFTTNARAQVCRTAAQADSAAQSMADSSGISSITYHLPMTAATVIRTPLTPEANGTDVTVMSNSDGSAVEIAGLDDPNNSFSYYVHHYQDSGWDVYEWDNWTPAGGRTSGSVYSMIVGYGAHGKTTTEYSIIQYGQDENGNITEAYHDVRVSVQHGQVTFVQQLAGGELKTESPACKILGDWGQSVCGSGPQPISTMIVSQIISIWWGSDLWHGVEQAGKDIANLSTHKKILHGLEFAAAVIGVAACSYVSAGTAAALCYAGAYTALAYATADTAEDAQQNANQQRFQSELLSSGLIYCSDPACVCGTVDESTYSCDGSSCSRVIP